MTENKRTRCLYRLLPVLMVVFLLAGMFTLLAPANAYAVGGSLRIFGPGLNNPDGIEITQYQLRGEVPVYDDYCLKQQDVIYSTINTWPTKSWYRGQGVLLEELLDLAGGLNEEATQIRFRSNDNFTITFTLEELFAPRYRFPNFIDYDLPEPDRYFGHIPGDPSGAVEVPVIIAHKSSSSGSYAEIQDPENLSRSDANHLLYGQRAVTQQTNARFAKYLIEIEVLTDPPSKWDNPTASVEPGEVPAGTLVELHSPYDDEDKVHYTLDGSDPTIESPMYNWIASRWWSSRSDVLDEINRPIKITEDTTIKAIVIGPGRLDSNIVEFTYTVATIPVTGVNITEGDQELGVGQTVQLTAVVEPENATNKRVTWNSSNEAVATVSATGLVFAVAEGEAIITVTTEDGNFTASVNITVNLVPVTSVSITQGDQTLEVGQTIQLTAVIEPENATNKNVTWSSSNESVATVSETGLVTAISEGTADIRVTTEDGNFTDTITVNVVPVPDFVVENGTLIKYNGPGGDVVILDDLGITSIGSSVFKGLSNLTSVVIPQGVISIGSQAFVNCENLTSVSIPDSVTSIGSAFTGCSSLTSITIPEGVTSIAAHTFRDCTSLATVTIPESVTSIGFNAFQNCSSLGEITIPQGVVTIANYTFDGCSSLNSISIPEGVTSIGQYAFSQCSNLTTVELPTSLTKIDSYAFRNCSSLTEITIFENVTSIGICAFQGCTQLASATIHNPNVNIQFYAFDSCPNLTIYGFSGSTAQTYATNNSIPFEALGATAVTGVSITEGDQTLEVGQTIQLTAVVEPEDATNKNVSWSSSDEAVATVSETGLVTVVGVGEAIITVITEDGSFTDSITINAVPPGPKVRLQCNSGLPGATTFISISGFNAGAAGNIWFDIYDNEVIDDGEPSVAVNTDENGAIPLLTSLTVPSVSTGDYTVRADIGGIKASAVFTVTGSGIIVDPIYGNSLEQGTPRYITVTGTGFPASTPYRLFVDRNGNGIFDDGANKTGNTSADGTIYINSFSWPYSPTGIYNVLFDINRDDTIEASASIGVVPGLKISTPRGTPGTSIGMNLEGFSANAEGYVWFDTNGNEVWDEGENKAAVTTSATGAATSPGLYVPSVPPGVYQVRADIPACGLKANSVTYLIVGLALNPGSGTVGSSIDVTGYGIVPNQTGRYIWFDTNDDGTWNEDEPRADVTTDASGAISPVSITVPEVPAGTYYVRTTVAPNTMFAEFTVNAPPSVPVTGVSITEGDQELEIGQTIQLTAVVEPEDASNKNVTWSSSDEAVATVSETGLVTAVAEGTATIMVTTEDGDKTDSITVTVVDSSGPAIDVLYEGTVILTPGETFTVTVGSNEYTINDNTPLGALQAAAEAGNFTYVLSDKRWSYDGVLLLDDVGEYKRKSPGYWYAYVNDVYKDGYQNTPAGLNVIELIDGDKVEFYYAAGISDPTDLNAVKAAATAAVKTVVALSTIDVIYDGTVNLDPEKEFIVTAYNSGAEYTVNENTPLGALHKAAIVGGFTYDVTDKNHDTSGALLLDNVADYDYVKGGSQWLAYVNGEYKDGYNNPAGALNLIQLIDGDKVEFYYSDVEDETDFNAVKTAATAAVKITVANGVVPTDWTLQLSGARNETVTKAYFEEGLACSSSHRATWTDDEGNVWGGMPLWLLVAMVDDDPDVGDNHFNFNDELAAAGYEVKVIAGDGWSTVLDSADIARSDAYIVANTLNGEPLPLKTESGKDCWPLQLKGSAISGGQQVGNIVRIELSGLPEPPAGWILEMIGDIGDTITQEEFEEGLACTGSGHYQEWTDNEGKVWSGVPLWVLLGAVDDIENGSHWTFNENLAASYTVNVIAGDGFSKTFNGAEVANSNDYIVANKCDGQPLTGSSAPLRLVGDGVAKEDGSLGGMAVGNIVRIEIPELQTPEAEPGSWNLTLDGKISDVISQTEFEEGVACPYSGHLVEWTDDEGNVWSGIPLWYLAGWVDDRKPHSYDFNQAVAGYKVVVKASDGYSVDFESADINKSSDYIIANKCNGVALTDSWPLRLVGDGVATAGALTGKSVGKIAEIKLTSFASGGSGTIPELRIVKYGEDGTTIIAEEILNHLDMMEQFDVIGDGETVYKFQGVTFDPDDIWDENETGKGGYKIANAIKGTRIKDLCSLVGDMGTGTEVVLVASDGYETRLPYSSIYPDPSVYARQGDAILVWYADGKYVPDYRDGMRLFFTPEDTVYSQMDMHETLPEPYWHYYGADGIMYPSCAGLSAKYITEIRVYSVPQGDWTLELDGTEIGGIACDISKTYFESALACQFGANHKASYTDSKGRNWEGMPLWFLVGFVDDADQHSDHAFNNDLANAGYQVVITAGDGASVTLDSADIIRNNNYIIANMLDGFPIPETDDKWPLRLVGPKASGSGSIGNIVKIELVSSSPDNPVYTVTPVTDSTYTVGETQDGIKTMTVNAGVSGLKYFAANIETVVPHSGQETVVFTHTRNGVQLGLNCTVADFDQVSTAQAGFNVKAGDVIKVYIVDELTNDLDHNPVILQ